MFYLLLVDFWHILNERQQEGMCCAIPAQRRPIKFCQVEIVSRAIVTYLCQHDSVQRLRIRV